MTAESPPPLTRHVDDVPQTDQLNQHNQQPKHLTFNKQQATSKTISKQHKQHKQHKQQPEQSTSTIDNQHNPQPTHSTTKIINQCNQPTQ